MPMELKITLNDAGQVSVSGPIEQKLLCYGLLVIAKDVIASYQPSLIVQPTMVTPPDVLKGNGQV